MEFALHGLAEYSKLSKSALDTGTRFKDLLSSMFSMPDLDDISEDDLKQTALTDEKVVRFIADKTVRKVIVIPGRLVNVVAN